MGGVVRVYRRVKRYAPLGSGFRSRIGLCLLALLRDHPLNNNRFVDRIGRRFYPDIVVNVLPKNKSVCVAMDTRDLSHYVVFDEIFIKKEWDAERVQFNPQLIVDCGAHIGLFSTYCYSFFPNSQYLAFEPDLDNFRWLQKQKTLNQAKWDLRPCAVGASDGIGSFEQGQSSFGGKLISSEVRPEGDQNTNNKEVEIVKLSAVIAEYHADNLLLKMDIEGGEAEVLPDLLPSLPQETAIFLETHGLPFDETVATALLTKHGFEVEIISRCGNYVTLFADRMS